MKTTQTRRHGVIFISLSGSRSVRFSLIVLAMAFATGLCSGGYITPGSLAETEQAAQDMMASATALANLLSPTETQAPQTPTPTAETSPTPAESPSPAPPYVYTAQSGDTLAALAARFGVPPEQIVSAQDIPTGMINAGQIFAIPNVLGETSPHEWLLPDSEIIYSQSAIGFSVAGYAGPFAGYLMSDNVREYLASGWHTGPAIVERVAQEQSINPRILLSILQYQSNWVLGEPLQGADLEYPIGIKDPKERKLYHQLGWVADQLSVGYYGWRDGALTELIFRDGAKLRIAPDLNAGTVALQYLFSKLYSYEDWLEVIDPETGFVLTHSKAMFPDPWARASQVEPLFPPQFEQPHLSLPFFGNHSWYFTSGPHGAWDREGAMAALDFAPGSDLPGCSESGLWIAAAGPGLVARVGRGVLVVDMDGDGNEQTGWNILYLHVSNTDLLHVGDWVNAGDKLGNPSCEGGFATGTHLHIARKYNGEWINAAGPVPFNLSGWVTQDGGGPYLGSLVRDGSVVTACTCSNASTRIARSSSDPY